MEAPGGESSVNTNDELNKFEVSPNMDSYVVDSGPNSSWDGTLKETCGLRYKDVIAMKFDSVEVAWAFYHSYSRAVGFGKDMYNMIDAKRRDEAFESDSHVAFMYVLSKTYSETNFYCRFSTYEKVRLANIFWRDSHSLFEYQCFEDVLVFNSTYKTNAYAISLVLFVGVNNHRATCVFGVALLSDENVQWYIWVLNTLMESVGHKHPIYILTDRDEAMRQAIDEIFPNSWHKICGWHVAKNESTHLHTEGKKSPFRSLLFKQLTEDEFKELWNKMLEQHGLE
ncbi:hypothetical protein Dsin_019554 [Dipteronia sinensis]|uniref:MULE transposase domain-containing protein n=1 Tax=Dipteronia sinensis TaxID=43782 RepID=A0AAE0A8U0_9ROSI|nr:hypothetical protein Dsin_019554 [Dipteronia sinensis]